ncbi:YifB family Mg chelatase-like AAA ATPase [Advenella mimigardefordensis]|uniref:Putative Mg chelatase-like protein n=1 Tax=Advenella mimigardefordensis (strain DSM 17166 / LMG 22922 / DPN7) TaxID=1247726 RepID=W0PH58_ADVMD|nr:YifB family Mg chelatase-like AAA ATPase [Advenella mimigardefordensis]AHG64263.1 putative Mg chelatase-like protein [Advenella mimigardefordensis DPN7]
MSLAVLASRALCGMHAPEVLVEVHLAQGLPSFTIVGLPDAGVRESRERVRSAILSSGYTFPAGRLTANLAPADIPKESGRFDLPIALGVLLASGQLVLSEKMSRQTLPGIIFAGELSLTGALVPVAAPLVIALAAARTGDSGGAGSGPILMLPIESACMAAAVPGLKVIGARTLREAAGHLDETAELAPVIASTQSTPEYQDGAAGTEAPALCLSDVRGQQVACRALEVAASGSHGLLMSGSPGIGKSMLAQRLPGLLPPLDENAAIEVAAIHSLRQRTLRFSRSVPIQAPHHSSTAAALIGGGSNPRPGQISLAHHGVLFLDELPEFQRHVLEALREPMETGEIHIARANRSVSYPCRFQLVAAMNPCPCGYLGSTHQTCRCTPEQIERYRARLSGPFLDRLDMLLQLSPPPQGWQQLPPAESSGIVRQRVIQCRERQLKRQGRLNAQLTPDRMDTFCVTDAEAAQLLARAGVHWGWSARAMHRVLRVARTIADMAGAEQIRAADLTEAMSFRQQLAR